MANRKKLRKKTPKSKIGPLQISNILKKNTKRTQRNAESSNSEFEMEQDSGWALERINVSASLLLTNINMEGKYLCTLIRYLYNADIYIFSANIQDTFLAGSTKFTCQLSLQFR